MRKDEQKFTTQLQKWLKHYWQYSGPIEVKISHESKFNLKSNFKPHQISNLLNAWKGDGCLTYKISDLDQLQKPFDLVVYYKSTPMVAIMWIKPGNKTFYLIHPTAFASAIVKGRKSIDETWAKAHAFEVGKLC